MKQRVWIGFCDGVPHVYNCEEDGRCIAVYPTRKAAREKYEDVRPGDLHIAGAIMRLRKGKEVKP